MNKPDEKENELDKMMESSRIKLKEILSKIKEIKIRDFNEGLGKLATENQKKKFNESLDEKFNEKEKKLCDKLNEVSNQITKKN